MKTLVYFSIVLFVLSFINTGNLFSQGTEIQSQQANMYLEQFDSLNLQNGEKSDSALKLNNNSIDSMIQLNVDCMDNRIYLADSNALNNHGEIAGLVEKMELEMNTIQTQTQEGVNYQKQEMDSCMNMVKNSFMYQVQELDSAVNQYEYMQSHQEQYGDSAINAVYAQIQNQCQKLDSMLQKQEGNCNQYRHKLDSIIHEGKTQLDSMFMKNKGEIDSLLGIKTQTQFRISHKNANSGSSDSLNNNNKRKLSEVIEEIVLIDTADIRIKFTKKLTEPQEIKNLFKLKLVELLKSTTTESIEIFEVLWSEQKADVLQLIINVPLYNPELIELEYDGEVEINTDGDIILKSATGTTGIFESEPLNHFIIYPNPVIDYLKISPAEEIHYLSVYNINGTKVMECIDNFSLINMSNLQSGIYIINFIDNYGSSYSRKIIKK
ncbi:T9SS type A sorting domain-containing protein [Bacteroidota bacterium]